MGIKGRYPDRYDEDYFALCCIVLKKLDDDLCAQWTPKIKEELRPILRYWKQQRDTVIKS
jgi:hypothetical protein